MDEGELTDEELLRRCEDAERALRDGTARVVWPTTATEEDE
jgi:hypothetical protein